MSRLCEGRVAIATEIWADGKIVSLRARVPARDVTVINNGKCTLR